MNKNDFLQKIKEENECDEPYEKEANLLGWRIGSIITITLGLLLCVLEWIFLGRPNVGVFGAAVVLLHVNNIVSAIKLKKLFNIIIAVISSLLLAGTTIVYIVAFINGWL